MVMVSDAQKEQRNHALKRANGVRSRRAEIKRQLHAREIELEDLLADPPPEILRATIGEVLEWCPGIGKWRSQRILASGIGNPGVGRMVPVAMLSSASKGRVLARYEEIRPGSYGHLAA
jgi:hypothetical protein